MALSDGEILDIWSPGSSRPVLGKNKVIDFAHCIEGKVRKEYEVLIQQMLEALEQVQADCKSTPNAYEAQRQALAAAREILPTAETRKATP